MKSTEWSAKLSESFAKFRKQYSFVKTTNHRAYDVRDRRNHVGNNGSSLDEKHLTADSWWREMQSLWHSTRVTSQRSSSGGLVAIDRQWHPLKMISPSLAGRCYVLTPLAGTSRIAEGSTDDDDQKPTKITHVYISPINYRSCGAFHSKS